MRIRNHGNGNYESRDFNIRMETSDTYLPPIDRETGTLDYSKIKVGAKTLEDAVIDSPLKKVNRTYTDKENILRWLHNGDVKTLKQVSKFFYRTSGIYQRLCRYLAYMYRYDWYVVPYVDGGDTYPDDGGKGDISAQRVNKIIDSFFKTLRYLDEFKAKSVLKDIALKIIVEGCYYGYIELNATGPVIQELPSEYCRSRYKKNGCPVVEFNMKYFDDYYTDPAYRVRVVKLFPDDIQKGYKLYLQKKLKPDFNGDTDGWYLLDPDYGFKLNLNDDDLPIMASVIPAIIDLDEAQALDRKKMAQKLLKIIIQKMPIDKNGDLIFDPEESQQLHNNAVKMLTRAIGLDVLTTYADVEVADMSDRNTTTTVDDLQKVERTVFNEAGISQMQFNTDSNISLERSIENDAAMMSVLCDQFEVLMQKLIQNFNKTPKKVFYQVQILPTTIYNYKDISKLYKEQTQMGYSKMLPQIALGLSQSSILANAFFENDLLNLVTVFVPPLTSNTMNADALAQQQTGRRNTGISQIRDSGDAGSEEKHVGRPEKSETEKSTKTLQNLESKN
jgi:HD superfamily phosphohydrolase